jgi:hypothetical protein
MPTALELKIGTQTQNIISRFYNLFSFVFDWKTRLTENLPFNATYNVTLHFNSLGGVDDVRFCSKTGAISYLKITFTNKANSIIGALQIIRSEHKLKGCQLITKAGKAENFVYDSSNCSNSTSDGNIIDKNKSFFNQSSIFKPSILSCLQSAPKLN